MNQNDEYMEQNDQIPNSKEQHQEQDHNDQQIDQQSIVDEENNHSYQFNNGNGNGEINGRQINEIDKSKIEIRQNDSKEEEQLRLKNDQLNQQLQKLQQVMKDNNQKYEDLEQEHISLQQNYGQLLEQIINLQNENEKLLKDKEGQQLKIQELSTLLQVVNDNSNKKYEDLECGHKSLKQDYEQIKEKLIILQDENMKQIKQKEEQHNLELQKLQQAINESNKKYEDLEQIKQQFQQDFAQIQDKLINVQTENIKQLNEKEQLFKIELSKLQQVINDDSKKYEDLEQIRQQLQKDYEQIKQKLINFQDESIKALNEKDQQNIQEKQKLQLILDNSIKNYGDLKQENKALKQEYEEIKEQLISSKDGSIKIIKEKEEQLSLIQELEQKIQQQQIQLNQYEQNILMMRIEERANKEQYLNTIQEYETKQILSEQKHQQQCEELSRIVQELKLQLETVQSEGQNLQQSFMQVEILQNQVKTLEEQLQQKQQPNKDDALQLQLEELQQHLVKQEEDYSQQFDKQTEVINALNENLKKANEQILVLEQKNSELQLKIDSAHIQQAQQQSQEKMVSIPVKELMNWDKKSKDQLSQIKVLQIENQQLKQQIEETTKLQNSKQMKNNLSLEGMSQRVQALQEIIDSTSFQNQKMDKELHQFSQVNQQLKDDLASAQAEIKDLREIASQKFKLEGELNQAQLIISDLRDQYKQANQVRTEYEALQEEFERINKQFKNNEQIRLKLQQKYDDTFEDLQNTRKLLQDSNHEKDLKSSKVKDLEKMLSQQFQEQTILEQKYKDQCTINEDLRNQQRILIRKHTNESDSLKEEILLRQKMVAQLQEQNQSMQRDLQILREHQFRQPKVDNTPVTKKEKIVLESLSVRVQELEYENRTLKDNSTQKIQNLQQQLDKKIEYINQIAAELGKHFPGLEDAEIDREDRKFVEESKKKVNVQEILEKTLVENLQLREQIKFLGSELNKRY